jgi:hypothetical protein
MLLFLLFLLFLLLLTRGPGHPLALSCSSGPTTKHSSAALPMRSHIYKKAHPSFLPFSFLTHTLTFNQTSNPDF